MCVERLLSSTPLQSLGCARVFLLPFFAIDFKKRNRFFFVFFLRGRKLYLAGNKLVGPIPDSLGNISTLSDLSLAGNELSGPIPNSFGNLTLLRYLRYWLEYMDGSFW